MNNAYKKYILIVLLAIPFPVTAQVQPERDLLQRSPDFQIARSLYQQQRYEEAANIYGDLLAKNPTTYIFLEHFTNSLIQLKQYDEAIQEIEKYNRIVTNTDQTHIKLGEIYHLKGDTTRAFDVWNTNLDTYPRNFQLYVNTARIMVQRREYDKAIEVFQKGRVRLNNNELFFNDIADVYMQAGEYENAIKEYVEAIKFSPQYMNYVQRVLFRYNDPLIFDIAIIEFEDVLSALTVSHPSYATLHEVLIWMLQENKLYRRALTTAIRYEESTSDVTYAVYNLARSLLQNREFELSAKAFTYYIDNGSRDLQARSTEEIANVHVQWAKYLEDFGLNFGQEKDSLYTLASSEYEYLETEVENYNRIDRVYLAQAELALDYFFDIDKASTYAGHLKRVAPTSREAEIAYLEGRVYLFNGKYPEARLSLTKSNKLERTSGLAEKTRYYLALTDFYAGDYEFGQIQLKALGRENTSLYANDALKLRIWIQKGIDSDLDGLDQFAIAVKLLNSGKKEEALNSFFSMTQNEYHTYADDAAIVLSEHIPKSQIYRLYVSYTSMLNESSLSPLKERLLWEQAKLGEFIVRNDASDEYSYAITIPTPQSDPTASITIIPTELYERLVLEYPQGFYAPFARKRLSELPKKPS